MKRLLILVLVAATGAWLLAGPWAVGAYLRGWLPEWVEQWDSEAEARVESGWFSSTVRAEWPDGGQLELRGRHLPPLGGAWIRFGGELHDPAAGPRPIGIDGRLGLLGTLLLNLEATDIEWAREIRVTARDNQARLRQGSDFRIELEIDSAQTELSAPEGGVLDLGAIGIRMHWRPESAGSAVGSVRLEADMSLNGHAASSLLVVVDNLDTNAGAELLAALRQLHRAPPDSFESRMAALAVAGAWQALVQAGLELETLEFRLDGQTRFSGHWDVAFEHPMLAGEGRTETLLDWLAPIIALAGRMPPPEAERAARGWLQALADQGWLEPEGERFNFQYRGERLPGNAAP